MASLCKSYHGALGRTRRYAQAKSSGLDVREDLKSESVYDVRACVYICVPAQVCRGSRAGSRTDRCTGCLWGQGLGGVLAGTTPDSDWADAPWQFCTFMSLLIKVSTCWAGGTTVPVQSGPPYRTRRGWEHFLPPVLPRPSVAHWADKSGQLWWLLVGQGWRCQPWQYQRWEQSCMTPPDLGSEKENLDVLALGCVTAKGKGKCTELSV